MVALSRNNTRTAVLLLAVCFAGLVLLGAGGIVAADDEPPSTDTTIEECTVLAANGTYTLTEDLDLTATEAACLTVTADEVTIDGQGHTITGVGEETAPLLLAENASSVTLTNLTIDGWGGSLDATPAGVPVGVVTLDDVEAATIENVTVTQLGRIDAESVAVLATGGGLLDVTDLEVDATSRHVRGVLSVGVEEVMILDSTFNELRDAAIVSGAEIALFNGVETSAVSNGLSVSDTNEAVVIDNMITIDGTNGIATNNVETALIFANTLDGPGGYGLAISYPVWDETGSLVVVGNDITGFDRGIATALASLDELGVVSFHENDVSDADVALLFDIDLNAPDEDADFPMLEELLVTGGTLSDVETGIEFRATAFSGGTIQDATVENVAIENATNAIVLDRMQSAHQWYDAPVTRLDTITFENVHIGDGVVSVTGENVTISEASVDDVPDGWTSAGSPVAVEPIGDEPTATVELDYDLEHANETVALWQYDGEEWHELEDATVDETAGTISATVTDDGILVPLTEAPTDEPENGDDDGDDGADDGDDGDGDDAADDATGTDATDDSADDTADDEVPGFGVLVGVLAVLALVFVARVRTSSRNN